MYDRSTVRIVIASILGGATLGFVSYVLTDLLAEAADHFVPGRSPHSGSLGMAIRILVNPLLTVISGLFGGLLVFRCIRKRK